MLTVVYKAILCEFYIFELWNYYKTKVDIQELIENMFYILTIYRRCMFYKIKVDLFTKFMALKGKTA